MTKFVFLLAMGLMIGCSNASKKATTETATGPSTATTPAPTTTAATVETKKEDTKKSKTKAAKTAGDANAAAEVTCTSKQEVRKLSIKAKDQGCELEYTKGGQPTSVASQVAGQAKCEEVSTRIKEKLVAAGYTCE